MPASTAERPIDLKNRHLLRRISGRLTPPRAGCLWLPSQNKETRHFR